LVRVNSHSVCIFARSQREPKSDGGHTPHQAYRPTEKGRVKTKRKAWKRERIRKDFRNKEEVNQPQRGKQNCISIEKKRQGKKETESTRVEKD